MPLLRAVLPPLCLLAASGCRGAPPGAGVAAEEPAVVEVAGPALEASAPSSGVVEPAPGSVQDAVPFEPSGLKIASRAWRTWVYTDVGARRTRYGYLRAGAIVDARGPAIVNEGCEGGWYRINPRGFVCIGKGATLDLEDPVVVAADVRPVRGQGLPYLYGQAADPPPLRYVRLPTEAEVSTAEGAGALERARRWNAQAALGPARDLLGEPGPPPDWMRSARALPKPWGAPEHLHLGAHSGRAPADAGFSFLRVVEHDGRWYGQTSEHDLLPLDRVRIVRPSAFHGLELPPPHGLPAAIVTSHFLQRFRAPDGGSATAAGSWPRRTVVPLTGGERFGMWETRDGELMPKAGVLLVPARTSFPSFATGDRKWLDISIRDQVLVAYEGTRAVYVTLVSTGRGGMGDPEKTFATPRGTFMVVSKHVAATMDGDEDKGDSYNLLDVPFVQYFHKGYALHGAYWHDQFGEVRSHGCINLAPIDAAWLFEWTDPSVPDDWHSVLNKERGTVVFVRY